MGIPSTGCVRMNWRDVLVRALHSSAQALRPRNRYSRFDVADSGLAPHLSRNLFGCYKFVIHLDSEMP
jgi:hypothetical protein